MHDILTEIRIKEARFYRRGRGYERDGLTLSEIDSISKQQVKDMSRVRFSRRKAETK